MERESWDRPTPGIKRLPEKGEADRSNIGGERVLLVTLFSFALYSRLHTHKIPAHQG